MRFKCYLYGLVAISVCVGLAHPSFGRSRTGVIEKVKKDGEKIEVFTDTVYEYTLTTPSSWDFDLQKEKGDGERNPFRLKIKCKDKQIPDQLWEAQGAVTRAYINWFIFEGLDMTPQAIRDSIFSDSFDGDWQDPIYKHCDMLLDAQYLNKGDIKWGPWQGVFYSLDKEYSAQVGGGGGGFQSITEKRLAEVYVFPFKGNNLVLYLISERQFLPDNRAVVKELLSQIEPIPGMDGDGG